MMEIPTINEITFSENAYFYKILNKKSLTRETIKSFCRQAKGNNKSYIIGKLRTAIDDTIKYTLILFKTRGLPTYLNIDSDFWKEEKIGYFLIIEYDGYVAILKKNSHAIKIQGFLVEIEYQTLLNIFLTQETSILRVNMRNIDGSEYALQSKILESNDLRRNVSAFGSNRYYLQSYKGKNSTNGRFSLTMGTSRINWQQTGVDIYKLSDWVKEVVNAIKAYNAPSDNFMSLFAEPVSYKNQRVKLEPDSIIVYHNELFNCLDNPNAMVVIDYKNKTSKNINEKEIVNRYLSLIQSASSTIISTNNNNKRHYYRNSDKGWEIQMESDKISISSLALRRIKIYEQPDGSDKMTFEDLINTYSWFNVYFTDTEFCYSHRTLLRDHSLLNSKWNLLDIMKPYPELSKTNCEKLHKPIFVGVTQWDPDSIFKFVEDKFCNQYDHFVCDDCGDEWADHIGISDNIVSFFCSKHKGSNLSASNFQDIVGQALKNLGNLTPRTCCLEEKIKHWKKNHTTSQIKRYRSKKGKVDDIKDKWEKIKLNSDAIKEMCIVVDFISKSDLSKALNSPRKEVFQILWILSSFVASCKEVGVKPIIYCKD